jgi:hypothetical protein
MCSRHRNHYLCQIVCYISPWSAFSCRDQFFSYPFDPLINEIDVRKDGLSDMYQRIL